ncbi:MAG: GAF domain-containing protein, partial [Aquabacterium sp.]
MTTIANRPHEEVRSPPAPVAPSVVPDAVLTALAALACTLCQTPIALISRVTPQRQHLVAQVGLLESGAALPHLAWTITTLNHTGLLVVPDVAATPHWQDDWLASGPAGIRFYAGLALHGPDGQPIGTLCVMDTQPRELDAATQAQLSALAQV